MILINEIKGKMRAKGITHELMAEKMGISPKTLSDGFSKGILGSNQIEKIIEILEISNPVDIFFNNDVTQ